MSEINKIASSFLKQLERGGRFYKEETITPEPIAAFTGLVALKRSVKPEFFHGFKPSGRPVFTHDLRLAKSFHTTRQELEDHINQLEAVGETVLPHPTVWFEGKHRDEHS
jgi:hypothetical protein